MTIEFAKGPHALGSYVVYIAGVEMPVSSVNLQFSIGGQDPAIVLSLSPDIYITRFGARDRVDVQVFYLDRIYGKEPTFRLIFDGIITGWAFQRDIVNVSVSLTGRGVLLPLKNITANFLTSVSDFARHALANPSGTNANIISVLPFPWNVMFGFGPEVSGEQEEDKFQQVKRPFDFIFNLLKLVYGKAGQQLFGSVACAYFHGKYNARLSVIRRFIPSPIIEFCFNLDADNKPVLQFPVLEGLDNALMLNSMGQSAANAPRNLPVWDIIQQLLQQIYFETASIPAPPFYYVNMKDDLTDLQNLQPAGRIIGEDNKGSSNAWSVLGENVTKPLWFFGAPPVCNVVFPSMLQEVHFEENYIAQPTRTYVNDNALLGLFGSLDSDFSLAANMCAGYPKDVQRELDKRWNPQSPNYDPAVSGNNLLVWPEEFYLGPIPQYVELPQWLMFILEAQLASKDEVTKVKNALDEYLQKIKPLAEQRDSLISQTEAAQAETGEKQKEKVEEIRKKAEELKKKATDIQQKDFGELKKSLLSLLSEKSPLYNAIAAASNFDTLVAAVFRFMRGPIADVYQRFAAYEHWRVRCEQRAGTLTMTFNPYFVPGFTMFVFDTSATGQHFFAYATDVRHEMSPAGWLTQVNFTHVILLREYIELLIEARDQIKQEQTIGDIPENMLELALGKSIRLPPLKEEELPNPILLGLQKIENEVLSKPEETAAPVKSISQRIKESPDVLSDVLKVLSYDLIAVPRNPIWQYQILTQHRVVSDHYFRELLWGNVPKNYCVFDIPYMLKLNYYDAKKKAIVSFYLQNVLDIYAGVSLPGDTSLKFETVDDILSFVSVSPADEIQPGFENYETALKFCSRPVCTLNQYVKFRSNDLFPNTPSEEVLYDDPRIGKGTRYYKKLFDAPHDAALLKDITENPSNYFNENNQVQDPDLIKKLPYYSKDWQNVLSIYRKRIYSLPTISSEKEE